MITKKRAPLNRIDASLLDEEKILNIYKGFRV